MTLSEGNLQIPFTNPVSTVPVCLQVNKVSGRREYVGDLQAQLMAILSAGHGGQILLSSAAHDGIATMRATIAQSVSAHPDYDKLSSFSRGPSQDFSRYEKPFCQLQFCPAYRLAQSIYDLPQNLTFSPHAMSRMSCTLKLN